MTQACKDKYPAGFETWAVGYYNEWGGVAFGKAIPKSGQPQIANYLGTQMPAGLPFPQGTVVVKFLTTNAPPDCVPYLKGSPEWQIDRHVLNEATQKYTCTRAVQISRIVQVDVAVTDPRSPTGWVYGTYAYDAGTERHDVLGSPAAARHSIRRRPLDLPRGAQGRNPCRRSRACSIPA